MISGSTRNPELQNALTDLKNVLRTTNADLHVYFYKVEPDKGRRGMCDSVNFLIVRNR